MSSVDETKAENFADNYVNMLNGAALILMTSIGHQTGLFDIMSEMPPATSEEIAIAATLNERYVREWLGAMVTGKFIDYDPTTQTYVLPVEHSGILTRAAAPNNYAVYAQWIPLLGTVESKIIDVFKNGGGVPYAEFKQFHRVMAEDSWQTVVSALNDHILPLVPEVIERLKEGIDALDVGCGRGLALMELAKRFPKSQFIGFEISEEALSFARKKAKELGLTNTQFEIQDVSQLNLKDKFDFITAFDAIHDQKTPLQALKGINKALRPDGTFLMQDISGTSHLDQDIDHPFGPMLYTISCMHCMTVSLSQDGEGLGTMWGIDKAKEYLTKAGFTTITVNKLPHDETNVFFVITKS